MATELRKRLTRWTVTVTKMREILTLIHSGLHLHSRSRKSAIDYFPVYFVSSSVEL